jgi:hypothetical protein
MPVISPFIALLPPLLVDGAFPGMAAGHLAAGILDLLLSCGAIGSQAQQYRQGGAFRRLSHDHSAHPRKAKIRSKAAYSDASSRRKQGNARADRHKQGMQAARQLFEP